MIEEQTILAATRDQVSVELDGEAVILNIKTGIYYGLENVGARIWSLIQKPVTVHKIRDTIVKEYDVEPDCCQRDLLSLLKQLSAQGLMEVQNNKCEDSKVH